MPAMAPIGLLGLLVQLPGCQVLEADRILECVRAGQRYAVVLPAGYSREEKRWPAILLLHGNGRNHRTLIEDAATKASLLESRAVIVMPDGGKSWWRDQKALLDLLDWLGPQLNLDRRRTACAGWSMGGYGSLKLAVDHPERFAAWGGMIGLVDFPNPAYPPEWNYTVPALFGDPGTWAEANPIRPAHRLRGKAVWFGTAEEAFDAAMNRTLHRLLNERGIGHTFVTVSGKHTFPVVAELLPKMLKFLDESLP
jgi:S-formylglutathione hydrolase FrmB